MKTCFDCEEVTDADEELDDFQGDPICAECKREHKCTSCYGSGTYSICRNERGDLDYIRGRPTGEKATCDMCKGEGYR